MKFGTALTSLAKKAGIDTTQKEFVDLLAVDVDIPDGIANALEKGLMNVEAAKNNSEVRKAIRTEALNGVDSKVGELLEELGISEADDITGEKNSYEKVRKLVLKVKDLEGKKATSNKGADKEAYEKQIAELNQKIKEANTSLTTKEKEFAAAREGDLTSFELHKKLLGKNYSLPAEMDSDIKLSTAQSAINKVLQAKELRIVRDANTGALKLVNKENLPAYNDKNEPLDIDSFLDGALAQNKLLKVNDQSQQQQGGGNNASHLQGGQQHNPYAQQLMADTDKELAALGVTL